MNSFLFAVHDIRESFSHTQLWLWTGLQDIKLRYRRSALGPWWLTISTGILVAAMGILYAGIFKHTISDYLPNFAVSFIFWIFFSGQINESATAFTQFENILKQTRIPLLSCVLRILTRHVIILLHNALIILIAFIILGFYFYLMETVRRPFFGLTITFALSNGALLCTAISILTSAFLFLQYRARITYWFNSYSKNGKDPYQAAANRFSNLRRNPPFFEKISAESGYRRKNLDTVGENHGSQSTR